MKILDKIRSEFSYNRPTSEPMKYTKVGSECDVIHCTHDEVWRYWITLEVIQHIKQSELSRNPDYRDHVKERVARMFKREMYGDIQALVMDIQEEMWIEGISEYSTLYKKFKELKEAVTNG